MVEETPREILFNIQPYKSILFLRSEGTSYASEISSTCDTTYSHSVKIMNRLLDQGLVDAVKKGRKKEYTLTENGKELADHLREIENLFDSSIAELHGRSGYGKLEQTDAFS
jgi:DNA-binding PadR family transcriptional regulator